MLTKRLFAFFVLLTISSIAEVNVRDARLSPRLLNYQGYLTDDQGIPITNPSLSMTFSIYDEASAGNQKWTETQISVDVNKGVFSVLLGSVTLIPDTVFTAGTDRWLELVVGGQTLTPRTRITSVGYAYTSTYSDTAEYAKNTVADNDWTFIVSDGADTTLQMGGKWGLARSGNVMYGNADSTHVNFGVECTTGTSGQNNRYCTIAGGFRNTAGAHYSAAISGSGNTASGMYGTVSGGIANTVSGSAGAVVGGSSNTASGYLSTIGGGYQNYIAGDYSTICGGNADTITSTADYSYLFGIASKLTADSTFMVDMPHIKFGDEATGYEFPNADGTADQVLATDGSGQLTWSDQAADTDWVISDNDMYSGVSGNVGIGMTVPRYKLDINGIICGGVADTVKAVYGGVLAGYGNLAGDSLIDSSAVVAGGKDNSAIDKYTFIGGGAYNLASGRYATVAGGYRDTASGNFTTVGGGGYNTASGNRSTVCGGYENVATGFHATVGGGYQDTASSDYATVAGGLGNIASGYCATVAGGEHNTSAGDWSFTTGYMSTVSASYSYSAAFNGQTATASVQTRVGVLSKMSGSFTIDHPLDPENKILNHYFVESPGMTNIYEGEVILDASGRAAVFLPDYFDALNRTPRIQLTGIGTSDVYVVEKINGNRFVVGGKPGTEVYWMVTADRKDQPAEITRIIMPVEQPKEGELAGHSLDDDFLVSTMDQLKRMGQSGGFNFRTAAGREKYERMKEEGNR